MNLNRPSGREEIEVSDKAKSELRRVAETGECDGRSARVLSRLGYITEAAKRPYKLTPAGRKALKDLS